MMRFAAALLLVAATGLAGAQTALFNLSNDAPLGSFSEAWLRAAGDVNKDGWPDVVIGAPAYTRVFSGLDQAPLYTFTDGLTAGTYPNFIPVGAGAGDIDLDGFGDVVVGVGEDATSGGPVGAVRVYSGLDGGVLHLWYGIGEAHLGTDVAGPGDVNGDGRPDVFAARTASGSATSPPDAALVYSGLDGAVLYLLEVAPPGPPSGMANLVRVSGAGDADADGFADVAAAVVPSPWFSSGTGRLRVFSGKTGTLLHDLTDPSLTAAGDGLAPAGDLDGDGYDDLLVGAPFAHFGGHFSGLVEVVSGKTGEPVVARQGIATWGYFGHSVDGAGDVDNDGFPDFVVGEHRAPTATAYHCGQVHVYVQRGSRRLNCALHGAATDALFGTGVAGVSDVDQDGFDDVAALDPYVPGVGPGTGRATAFSVAGCPLEPCRFVPGSRLMGEITIQGDSDEAEFHAVYGSRFKVTVEVLSGDLIPRVEVINPAGEPVVAWKIKGGGPAKKKIVLKENGSHRLRVTATQGTLGSYRIRTGIKYPQQSSAIKKVVKTGKGSEKPPKISLRLPRGSILTVSVEPLKGLPNHPAIELLSPKGALLDIVPFVDTSGLGASTEIWQMRLLRSGKYVLSVAEPATGKTKARFWVVPFLPVGSEQHEID